MNNNAQINLDLPLQADDALETDQLARAGFAYAAASAFSNISSSTGLVVSVEGAWGSGKTSVLAMIEQILIQSDDQVHPLIVQFNPWLIGEKEALLRHFLTTIANAIHLRDGGQTGQELVKAIKAYSKAFDLLKFIPGAEPWASLVQSAGELIGNLSEYKSLGIEGHKHKVEKALVQLGRPIIVFIDDIDRLFPQEVFEMVRIIKSVGGLPFLGYVIAWDSLYVSKALDTLGVPFANSYLDKVVQVRMPVPSMSLSVRGKLINAALDALGPEATIVRFNGQDERLSRIYLYGLRDLLEQPRDFARIFNTVRMIEPLLRGEVVFADILGLAALFTKAPAVIELLRKKPELFVGQFSGNRVHMEKAEDLVKAGGDERDRAYKTSDSAHAVQGLVQMLFPRVAKHEKTFALSEAVYVEGHIGHPAKLAIALQLGMADDDVSISQARRYLLHPEQRLEIASSLTKENCNEFLELLGDVGKSLRGVGINDINELSIAIAALIETPVFVERTRNRMEALMLRAEDIALQTMSALIQTLDEHAASQIADSITASPQALTCAAAVVSQSFLSDMARNTDAIIASASSRGRCIQTFASNVQTAAENDELFNTNHPGHILFVTARVAPKACPEIYRAMRERDPALDRFALHYLGSGWDSSKGVVYSWPRDEALHPVFCPIDEFMAHAKARLDDVAMGYPARAAWRSVVERKTLYGVDGTEAMR